MNITTWKLTKLSSVLFNAVATYNVFSTLFVASTGSQLIGFLSAGLAILLIDVLYLALVNFLEEPVQENEDFRLRKPYAVGLLVLYLCIVAIGFKDEGWIAVAPRVGLGIIVLVSLYRYHMIVATWADLHWEEEFEKRKRREEREDERQLQKDQREIKFAERKKALKELKPELKNKYKDEYRRVLQLVIEGTIVHAVSSPKLVPQLHADSEVPSLESLIGSSSSQVKARPVRISKPLPEGISKNGRGFYWQCPYCDFDGHTNHEKGAKIARTRHIHDEHEPVRKVKKRSVSVEN